jgi:hypothetical protein
MEGLRLKGSCLRLIVTTIVRDSPLDQHGYVYVVDWEKRSVLRRFQPPPPRVQHNMPRGGSRGFRGITFIGDICYIANHDSIFGYDPEWRLVDTISHPFFASIHEIQAAGGDGQRRRFRHQVRRHHLPVLVTVVLRQPLAGLPVHVPDPRPPGHGKPSPQRPDFDPAPAQVPRQEAVLQPAQRRPFAHALFLRPT